MDATFELKWFLQSNRSVCFVVFQLRGIGHIDEFVVHNCCRVTFWRAEQWAGGSNTLDQVICDHNRREITPAIESEQSIFSGSRCGPRDNVIVADLQIVVDLIHPDHSSTGVTHQIIVESG